MLRCGLAQIDRLDYGTTLVSEHSSVKEPLPFTTHTGAWGRGLIELNSVTRDWLEQTDYKVEWNPFTQE